MILSYTKYVLLVIMTGLTLQIWGQCNVAAPTTTPKSRCGAGTVTFRARGCAGTYNWYNASSGGTLIGTSSPLFLLDPYDTDFTTPSMTATTTYYVDCTVGGCTSGRTAVKASIISASPKVNCTVKAPVPGDIRYNYGYTGFSFAGINSVGNTANGNYQDQTCNQQAIVSPSSTYPFTISMPQDFLASQIYIDYNNDGIFEDPSEIAFSVGTSTGFGTRTHSSTIRIPANAVTNTNLRMRVIVALDSNSPCELIGDSRNSGVAVDLSILILAPNPVSFISFTGQAASGQNLLRWQTSEETQNKGFDVERSSNAKSFERIGFVLGQSESKDLQTYNFTDSQPMSSTNYYRLKQLDNDGHFAYSRMVAIVSEVDQSFLVYYPNPTTNEITVKSEVGTVKEAQIMTINGTILMSKIATTETMIFSLKNIPSGTYLLNVAIDDYYVTKKIIKQ